MAVGDERAHAQLTGERQRLAGVAGGLVDPPGREAGRPRAQKDERRPEMKLAAAEFLDGIRHQRKRLIGPAGEGVGGAEGRSDDRCPGDELPRSAEVKAPLEDPGRAREIPATEVGETEVEQPGM